jgi:hypothetical protein
MQTLNLTQPLQQLGMTALPFLGNHFSEFQREMRGRSPQATPSNSGPQSVLVPEDEKSWLMPVPENHRRHACHLYTKHAAM